MRRRLMQPLSWQKRAGTHRGDDFRGGGGGGGGGGAFEGLGMILRAVPPPLLLPEAALSGSAVDAALVASATLATLVAPRELAAATPHCPLEARDLPRALPPPPSRFESSFLCTRADVFTGAALGRHEAGDVPRGLAFIIAGTTGTGTGTTAAVAERVLVLLPLLPLVDVVAPATLALLLALELDAGMLLSLCPSSSLVILQSDPVATPTCHPSFAKRELGKNRKGAMQPALATSRRSGSAPVNGGCACFSLPATPGSQSAA